MLNSTKMHIPTMRSVGETREVSDALVHIQGVADIGVNPDSGLVEVKFDPRKTDEAAIRRAVREAGHEPQV